MIPGQTILHYKILGKLGEGGMGIVYKAQDTRLERMVAIKFLPPRIAAHAEDRKRFRIEAKTTAALNHPNIAMIHAIEKFNDEMFIVMEFIDGQELREIITDSRSQNAPLPIEKIIDIAIKIAEGLKAAQAKGIIHRDIKSGNIMVTENGQIKIMDFGLAKMSGDVYLTKKGETLGTVAYMSPEQVRGDRIDHRTDIWSFGVVLYEMLSGQMPFKGEYDQAVMYAILNEKPEPLTRFRTDIPMELTHIVSKSLVKKTGERYQLAEEMLVELKSLGKKLESGGIKKSYGKIRFPVNHARILYGAIFFLILLIISAVMYYQQSDDKRNPESKVKKLTTTDLSDQWQNSIAVLPFKNISPDPEQEFFCDGMTEQLITNLSQLSALKVIARTSVMKFKNAKKTIPEIAKELNVGHVLEGSIRKAGNQIRVTAQLIHATEGHHLWTGEYDRELQDIFAVQEDVSESIARILLKRLGTKETDEIKTRGTQNAEAYEYYLKGNYFAGKFGIAYGLDYFTKSENMFKNAIAIDPNYALAFAGLARLYGVYTHHVSPDSKLSDLEQKYIETAFRLAPNSAFVNVARGAMYHNKSIAELEKAYESYKRALELSPNDFNANFRMGVFLGLRGLYHQAIQYFTRTAKLDPLVSGNYVFLGWAHRLSGDFDQAIVNYQKAMEIESDDVLALNGFARVRIRLKEYDQAEQLLSNSEKINPNHPYSKATRSWLYAARGNREKAFELLADIQEDNRFHTIILYCLLGAKSEAIRLLDKKPIAQYEESEADYLDMLHNPIYDLLRDTKEFSIALQKAKTIYEKNLIKYESVFL